MQRKYFLNIFIFIIVSPVANSQALKGGQFNFAFSNGLETEWYFNQSVSTKPFWIGAKSFSSDTVYLDKDLNKDGIPDLKWFIKLNAWRWKENEEDNSNDLALLTVPFKGNNGKSFEGSDIEIYQQFSGIIKVISDINTYEAKPIEKVNAFYRFSKVVPQNTSVRSVTSQPLLLQAPKNYKEMQNRTAVIQVLFVSKLAYYKSCDPTKSSEYYYYPCDKDDYSASKKYYNSWIVVDKECNSKTLKQETAPESCLINWGNEKVFSKAVYEIVLKW